MSKWKSRLQNIFERVDDWSDDVRYRLRSMDDYESLLITPYMGFGNAEIIKMRGRVLEDKGFRDSNETDSKWRNLKNSYRRFGTDEVPNALVKAFFQNTEKEVKTDREGYFDLEMNSNDPLDLKLWHDIELELLDPVSKENEAVKTNGQILIPPDTAKFGVISDIDDTILKTNVRNKFKMILTTVLSNAHTRVPFEGVAAFYQALQKGVSGDENNPIFYVSSSPYNLYNLLVKFLNLQEIPLGPIFLKDFGTHTPFISGDHKTHKLENIRSVLETYSQMQFILIGDNSEQDPEIYKQIVKDYPERIRTIYIRKVNDEFENKYDVEGLIKEVQDSGSQLIFAPDSEFAAMHAVGENLISAESISEVHDNTELDKDSPKTEDITEEDLVNN
jgi:phosphatidate phosphatase APP1